MPRAGEATGLAGIAREDTAIGPEPPASAASGAGSSPPNIWYAVISAIAPIAHNSSTSAGASPGTAKVGWVSSTRRPRRAPGARPALGRPEVPGRKYCVRLGDEPQDVVHGADVAVVHRRYGEAFRSAAAAHVRDERARRASASRQCVAERKRRRHRRGVDAPTAWLNDPPTTPRSPPRLPRRARRHPHSR